MIKVSVGLVSEVGCEEESAPCCRGKSWGCQPLSPLGCMSCMETAGHLLHIKVQLQQER